MSVQLTKREYNRRQSLIFLQTRGFEFKQVGPDEFEVQNFLFWPETGLFKSKKDKTEGRGVKNLMKLLSKIQKKVAA